MKFPAVALLINALLVIAPARANDSAIAACGPNDGYVTLYTSIETFEMAGRLPCGTQLELLESQKTYAAQSTPYLRVATNNGKQGYVIRSAVTIVHEMQQTSRAAATKVTPASPAASVARTAIPSEVRVLDGTELSVKLSNDLSSDHTNQGDIINLEVAEPLVIEGVTVFERGASAHARITQVKKAARWGHQGEISWAMQDLTAVDGTRIPAHFVGEPQSSSSVATAGILVASGNTMIVEQSTFSLHRGDAAFVPAGQIFKVYLHGDTVIRLAVTRAIQSDSVARAQQ